MPDMKITREYKAIKSIKAVRNEKIFRMDLIKRYVLSDVFPESK